MICTVKDYEKLSEQYNKMIEERNSLIDDLPWYKAKVSRLEEIREIKDSALKGADIKVKTLEQRISKLVSENTKLQNDLFSEQLIQDEADDKIKKLERENEQFKESHIKHITNMENYYKDRLQKLKEKNGELQEVIEGKNSDLLFTEDENAQLKQDLLRTEELQDEIIQLEKDFENKHNLLSEISQHIGNKPSSSTYKYFRGKLNALEIREGD